MDGRGHLYREESEEEYDVFAEGKCFENPSPVAIYVWCPVQLNWKPASMIAALSSQQLKRIDSFCFTR